MDPTVSRLKISNRGPRARPALAAGPARRLKNVVRLGILGSMALMEACGAATVDVPPPRPIIVHSGARIRPDRDELRLVNQWVTRARETIYEDPSFWVVGNTTVEETYPWENLRISADSVHVQIPLGVREGELVYQIYGFMHLMARLDRPEEWLPEAPDAVGYDLERAIMERVGDAWILARAAFDVQPFAPLDEIAYAKDAGFLDAFIFTARPDEFAVSRGDWVRANPARMEEYRDWFVDTFNQEPPGIRAN